MSNVIVSAILPCYNVENYIRKCLDSIVAQSIQEWEAILVDDGSTDGTGKICDEFARKDCRFIVVHTLNQGVSCARNEGIKIAKGEIIHFIDPDDWIEPDCFETCHATFKEYDCDIVHFSRNWWFGKECTTEQNFTFSIFNRETIQREYCGPLSGLSQDALNHYYQGDFIWNYKKNWQVWSFMFKRNFIIANHVLYPEGVRLFEDIIYIIEACIHSKKLVRIPKVLYNYEMKEDGAVMKQKTAERIFEDKYCLIEQRAILRKQIKTFDLHDYYIGSQVLSCLQLFVMISDKIQNIVLFRKYVRHPLIRESIEKVDIRNAPLKFKLPVMMLKMHYYNILFFIGWLLQKTGIIKHFS